MGEQNGGVKRKAGRPLEITEERIESICDWIASGRSLEQWCVTNGVKRATLTRYLVRDTADDPPEIVELISRFRAEYARARQAQAETLIDQIIEISDSETTHPMRARLMTDTRKWFASKVFPRIYGDKITQEISGPEGKPLHVHGTGFPPVAASYEEWLKSKKSEGGES